MCEEQPMMGFLEGGNLSVSLSSSWTYEGECRRRKFFCVFLNERRINSQE